MDTYYTELLLEELTLANVDCRANNINYYGGEKMATIIFETPNRLNDLKKHFEEEVRKNELEPDFKIYRERLIYSLNSIFLGLETYYSNTIMPTYSNVIEVELGIEADPHLSNLSDFELKWFKKFIEFKLTSARSCINYLEVNKSCELATTTGSNEKKWVIKRSKKESMLFFYFLHEIGMLSSHNRTEFLAFIEKNFCYLNAQGKAIPFENADIQLSKIINEITEGFPGNYKGAINEQKDDLFIDVASGLVDELKKFETLIDVDFNQIKSVWDKKYPRTRYLQK